MTGGRFVFVGYPWKAAIDTSSPGPRLFYARLVHQTLNYRMPSRRRFGRAVAWIGHRDSARAGLATALRILPRRDRPDVDELLGQIAEGWETLRSRDPSLGHPGRLSALALERSAALTVFVFSDEGSDPLVVAKLARRGDSVERESEVLERVSQLDIAPQPLGRIGDMQIQRAVAGEPIAVRPVRPETAQTLRWDTAHEHLARALVRLSATFVREEATDELDGVSDRVSQAGLSHGCETMARDSVQRVIADCPSVLRHGDVAPQNCLIDNERVALVDWELSRPAGVPGFDQLNAAMSYLEMGVGLSHWSEERVVAAFKAAWERSDYFDGSRAAARDSLRSSGADESLLVDVERAFFARRLARRLERPDAYPTGPLPAAAMLEFVCGR